MQKETVLGMGLSLVDIKTFIPNCENNHNPSPLTNDKSNTLSLVSRCPGGVVSNILISLAMLSPDKQISMLSRIGTDENGDFYQKKVGKYLGRLQRDQKEVTGTVRYSLDEKTGQVLNKISVYGASEKIQLDYRIDTMTRNGLFISNAVLFGVPRLNIQLHNALDFLSPKNIIFALNLGGIGSKKITKDTLFTELNSLHLLPQIIMGNEQEVCFLTDETNIVNATNKLFPEVRLLVVTLGEKGSLVRYEGEISHIKPYLSQNRGNLDTVGAGDCFMGTMLAYINQRSKKEDILKAASTASYAASLVVNSGFTQLQEAQAKKIRTLHQNL